MNNKLLIETRTFQQTSLTLTEGKKSDRGNPIVGGILALPQVWIAKQWNLVIVNLNVTLGYIIYLYTT